MHKDLNRLILWRSLKCGSSRRTYDETRLTHSAEHSELDKLLEDLADLIESEGGVLIL
jgi:hypothetical protein